MVFSSYIVWYLFLAGAASGAFVVSAACAACDMVRQTEASEELAVSTQGGFLVAPVVVILASLMLFADLGVPETTWQIVFSPFESIISMGAWLVALFSILSVAVALCGLGLRSVPSWFLWFSWVVGSVLGFGVMTYTGILLSGLVAIDFWHTWILPVLFIISSLSTGLACVLGANALAGGCLFVRIKCLRVASGFLAIFEAVVLVVFLFDRFRFSGAAQASCEMLLLGELAGFFWLGIVVCGIVGPLLAHVLYGIISSEAPLLFACAGVLIGGFFIRFCIVDAALYSPLAIGGFS